MKAPRILSATLPLILILCFCSISRAGDTFAIVGGGAKYQNVVGVAKNGAPFTSIQAALDSITDAADGNRYLVVVGPGTYQEQVQLKEWVDVRGASRQATKITSAGGDSETTATVLGADHSGISNLTIESTGDFIPVSVAVYNNGVSPRLDRLDIIVQGFDAINKTGVWNYTNASPEISDLSIQITGAGDNCNAFGIRNQEYSSPRIRNTTIAVNSGSWQGNLYGVYNYSNNESEMHNLDIFITGPSSGDTAAGIHNESSSGVITQCRITTTDGGEDVYGVHNLSSSASLTDTQITMNSTAGRAFYGVYNETSDGAVLRNLKIDIDATTSSFNIGVNNYQSSPTLSNLKLTVGGSNAWDAGVYNANSSPVMEYCSIQLDNSSTGNDKGIYNVSNSSPTLLFCDARGGNYGMHNFYMASTTVAVNCQFQGTDYPVRNETSYYIFLTSCILESGGTLSGSYNHCTDCYDENGGTVTCP